MDGLTREGGFAVVDAGAFGDFAGLWAACGAAREGGARCVVVDLRGEVAPAATAEELGEFALLPLPTVAAVAGEVSGGVLDLAAACDIRVCEAATVFRLHGSERIERLTGRLAGAGGLSAEEALDCGLVSEVAPEGRGLSAAKRIAGVIARRGPIAVELGKEAIWRGLEMPLSQALRFETDLTLLLQTTKDRAEGVAAFIEKREPRFTGE